MILSEQERNKVLQYLKSGEVIAAAPGYVQNHVTGGYTRINLLAYSDGTHDWTSEDIFNFENNNEDFDEGLINYILKK